MIKNLPHGRRERENEKLIKLVTDIDICLGDGRCADALRLTGKYFCEELQLETKDNE